ncbi:uncharacterized protein TRAVEDRAFT_53176 [Trametes versicolor FP-101664 SS1]|uniref:uncharacterized protein n=1 Tax=Trametes versicolor (strain FP-101664) TaxID=717944 RepID=UPI0004622FFC|nr:uncharacterized protein TRAVEDRAFT_53176 [Trametes versicolor FP-101664 SS1]EIW52737.1 hypothetical protein TRAVEDRAFT_53176 [Trametes versicolor FP-101664 SS1]
MTSGYEDYMTAPIALRQCYYCGKPESEQFKLKKPACRTFGQESPEYIRENIQAKRFGFRNVEEFSGALRDFVTAHTWAFQSYAKTLLAIEGGPEYMNTPPKVLRIFLKCLCVRGSFLDPARTFGFLGAGWQTVEEYIRTPTGALDWQRSATTRERSQRAHSGRPRYAGELHVLFAVDRISTWQGVLYTQYYPDPRAAAFWSPWVTVGMRNAMLADVLVLCAASIQFGLALRCVEGQRSVAALPGRFVRSDLNRWRWEPLFTDWDQYLAGARGIQEVDSLLGSPIRSRMDVPLLLQLVRVLL